MSTVTTGSKPMKRIYLSGPITGRPLEETTKHFSEAEAYIRHGAARNNVPIWTDNPLRACPPDSEWIPAMKICVGELVRCDGVALLRGWQKSKGAAIELQLAQNLHIPVVYVERPVDFTDLNELFIAAPETFRYYSARLSQFRREGVDETIAETAAVVELATRYLDPYGFEYIDSKEEI